jgi:hypothetical protein
MASEPEPTEPVPKTPLASSKIFRYGLGFGVLYLPDNDDARAYKDLVPDGGTANYPYFFYDNEFSSSWTISIEGLTYRRKRELLSGEREFKTYDAAVFALHKLSDAGPMKPSLRVGIGAAITRSKIKTGTVEDGAWGLGPYVVARLIYPFEGSRYGGYVTASKSYARVKIADEEIAVGPGTFSVGLYKSFDASDPKQEQEGNVYGLLFSLASLAYWYSGGAVF